MRHLPNIITFFRMVLVAPLFLLIINNRFDAAFMIAIIAGGSDALDGFLAKHYGWQSWLGGMLDPIADKLLLVISFIALTWVGALPTWLAFLVIGRDIVIISGATMYYLWIGAFNAAPSHVSKFTTLMQIVCVLMSLAKLAFIVQVPSSLNTALITITALLTVLSGIHYVVSWSGRAHRASQKQD